MGAWASRSPHLRFDHPWSAAAAMLSLGSMFDPGRAEDLHVAVDLRLPDGDFAVRVVDGRLFVEAGRNAEPDSVVTGDQNAFLAVLYAGRPLEAAFADGALACEGDAGAVARLALAFRKPVSAA
jgi:alkyl sulfatase BDS1-like metallo-beta-lactamase superfamily hydrolase